MNIHSALYTTTPTIITGNNTLKEYIEEPGRLEVGYPAGHGT